MTAILDYKVGNLYSLMCSLNKIGEEAFVTKDKDKIMSSSRLILPGVGAFGDAAIKIKEEGLDEIIFQFIKSGKPLLGICLGMQLLFDKSEESPDIKGLSLISGDIEYVKPIVGERKIPHMGWNSLKIQKESKLLKYTKSGDYVYFVHSYSAHCSQEYISSFTEYGGDLVASVEKDNIYATQFHPEKSGETGLKMLKAFTEIK